MSILSESIENIFKILLLSSFAMCKHYSLEDYFQIQSKQDIMLSFTRIKDFDSRTML